MHELIQPMELYTPRYDILERKLRSANAEIESYFLSVIFDKDNIREMLHKENIEVPM